MSDDLSPADRVRVALAGVETELRRSATLLQFIKDELEKMSDRLAECSGRTASIDRALRDPRTAARLAKQEKP
jgi:hypothetical protein